MGSQWAQGIRWLLVDSELYPVDALARELRFAGGQVRHVDPVGLRLTELLRDDAHIVLVDESQDIRFLEERMAFHAGFCWASILRLPFSELFARGSHAPDLDLLLKRAAPLLAPDRALAALACGSSAEFRSTAQALGVLRCLRAIATASDVFRVTLRETEREAQIELAGPLVLGARVERLREPSLLGEEALAFAIELHRAEITVLRKVRPETPWLVMPLDEALERALQAAHEHRVAEDDDSPTLRIPSPFLTMELAGSEAEPSQSGLLESTPPVQNVPTVPIRVLSGRFNPVYRLLAVAMLFAGLTFLAVDRALTSGVAPLKGAVHGSRAAVSPAATSPRSGSNGLPHAAAEAAPLKAKSPELPLASTPVAESTATPPLSDAGELAAAAEAALLRGEFDLARTAAERAISLRPRKLQYRVLLADVFAASGDTARALSEYEHAQEQRPSSPVLKQRISKLLADAPTPTPKPEPL